MSPLKIVIAGSRSITGEKAYKRFITHLSASLEKHRSRSLWKGSGYESLVIISGGAEGVDQFAKRYASENAFVYREFKPLYRNRRKDTKAPLRRNVDMAKEGDILVAMWNGYSPGTRHMLKTMEKEFKKPVYLLEEKH